MPIGISPQDLKAYAKYTQFGIEIVAPLFIGIGLDVWLDTAPWLTLIGVFLSLVYMVVRLRGLQRQEDAAPKGKS